MTDDVMRFFAAWMLTHEVADEGLKAAVDRGAAAGPDGMGGGSDAFVDGLAAMVAEEKERLKAELAARARGEAPAMTERSDPAIHELKFEVAELRGRLDGIEGTLDAIARKLGAAGAES
jgi:hypothetical protein